MHASPHRATATLHSIVRYAQRALGHPERPGEPDGAAFRSVAATYDVAAIRERLGRLGAWS